VLHILPWAVDPLGHGGTRRSAQICEWLADEAEAVDTWVVGTRDSNTRLRQMLRHLPTALTQPRGVLSAQGRLKYFALALMISERVQMMKPDLVVIETAPPHALLAGLVLSRMRLPYIVCPHNVESLVPRQALRDFVSRGAMMDAESEVVTRAASCVAISLLDEGIYKVLGARTVRFPYFPVRSELERFELIRKARLEKKDKVGFLVLGSVSNQPTLEGMRSIVKDLGRLRIFADEPIHVAGYRSESLHDLKNGAIRVHGMVSDSVLNRLLTEARCVVLRQPFTTGGLTRLVELNLCGLPVLLTGGYLQVRGGDEFGIYVRDELPCDRGFYEKISEGSHERYQAKKISLQDVV